MINILFPTILIHGIGGDTKDLDIFKNALETNGATVYNIEIGNGKIDSIFMNMNKQCSILSENIDKLSIEGKINLIGVSQGGLLARCYVERYSDKINLVHSLITYGTPHMGIYIEWPKLRNLEYWKNPYKYAEYLDFNDFLVYLNNEKNHTNFNLYRQNMINLDNFALIWSDVDKVVVPLQSAKFEFYNISEGDLNKPMPLDIVLSDSYIEDKLGLKTLDKTNRLLIEGFNCQHEEFKKPSCFLNNSYGAEGVNLLDFTLKLL
jgi:palmitoyl-protein thioesterase